MKCFECNGTGASCPDCWVCEGNRYPKVRRVLRLGFRKDDLEDIEDGYCRCPIDECRGDDCDLCDGSGVVKPGTFQAEVTRCLVFGLKQRIPPSIERRQYPSYPQHSYVVDHDRLLSAAAAAYCGERGWGQRWNVLAFGHEFHLTPKGEIEARRRYKVWLAWFSGESLKHWLAWMEADEPRSWRYCDEPPIPLPIEYIAQWADDGGAVLSHDQPQG